MAEVLHPRWDLIEAPGVSSVLLRAAQNVNRARPNTTEVADLVQDAAILVATTRNLIDALDPEIQTGLLYHRLRQDLLNKTLTEAKHLGSRVSYERLVGDFAE